MAAVGEPTQFVTLGSLDPTTGYRMLVTLTNAGAAVRRAEMTSRRYLDQHDWSGYLGELELTNADGGVKVQVVGRRHAGRRRRRLQPGDVIVGIKASADQRDQERRRFQRGARPTREPGQEIDAAGSARRRRAGIADGEAGAAAVRGVAAGDRQLSDARRTQPPAGFRRSSVVLADA